MLGTAYRVDERGEYHTDLVVWTPGRALKVLFADLPFPMFPVAMTESEQVLVAEFGARNPAVIRAGVMQSLLRPGDTDMLTDGISPNGVVIGVVKTATTPYLGFVWTSGQGHQIVGPPTGDQARCGVRARAVLCAVLGRQAPWSAQLVDLPPPDREAPRSVSPAFAASRSGA